MFGPHTQEGSDPPLQTQGNPPTQPESEAEKTILFWLTEEGGRIWSAAEIEREYGNPAAAEDALGRLHRSGLIHRIEEGKFVFASSSAFAAGEIWGHLF